ncbi:MAG TPA: CHAT domain-containing tetratricopeptide repeat protein [Allosphingosinicella sp.]|uniref:CHAT domain-containing protein n=1 Tax=Allosphingosinicella sp. TaxID=2823234 RepID=UPI002F27B6FD
MRNTIIATLAASMIVAPVLAAPKPQLRPSLQTSFRLGTGGEALCQVQSVVLDPAAKGMFDRAYSVVCRDAAQPVGRLYALRKGADDPLIRLEALRRAKVDCGASSSRTMNELAPVAVTQCKLADTEIPYRVYSFEKGRTTYVAEGLAGYDSALTLGLRTIVADRIIEGEIEIAATEAGDPAAFARVQAGSLDISQALDEGYRRNNSGNYAEAAEFFDTLLQRAGDDQDGRRYRGEYLINRALQRSNLGAFAEADALFLQADAIPTSDPVQLRLRRNFRALHLMNQRRFDEAAKVLDRKFGRADQASVDAGAPGKTVISATTAEIMNTSTPLAQQLTGSRAAALSPEERVQILEAQALLLQGSIQRRRGRSGPAEQALSAALRDLLSIRDGRVTSIARLRAQGLNELGLIAEQKADYPTAERNFREAVTSLTTEYPNSVAVAAANSRLAAYLARRGQTDAAIELYRGIVSRASSDALSNNISGDMLGPFFALLTREIPRRPELLEDFFAAGETLIRPGVASTQAVLARELSAGDDEAARLFRQSTTLTREIEQGRVALARQKDAASAGGADPEQIAVLTSELEKLQAVQAATQARLAEFPKFRALSTKALTLVDLRSSLKPGEAYLKMSQVGGAVYAMLITKETAAAYVVPLTPKMLDSRVSTIRDSISMEKDGEQLTYPFDVGAARRLFTDLFGPVARELATAKHIIFEPAGAMLKLPLNLLITDDASVANYRAQAATDEFDFRNIRWLGRDRDISTAVSARAFRDVRAVPGSKAKLEYLGLGENAPPPAAPVLEGPEGSRDRPDCTWPLDAWSNPISASELVTAQGVIGAKAARLLTGAAFTDAGVRELKDLSQYRILHFATHGLVAAPRPDCPAQPALLTSFDVGPRGELASDGLLTFKEIFDLRLDADIVILSACDTAGAATAAATREAGLASGGDFALDGLVRAFVGAGGRSIIASHWPLPDDFGATERLISSLFTAPPGTALGTALRAGQAGLMDEAATSHPYYWSGFAVIGDASRPVLRPR